MAITRTQIARQLLQFGGGADASKSDFGGNDKNKDRDRRDDYRANQYKKPPTKEQLQSARNFRDTQKVKDAFTKKTFMDKIPSGLRVLSGISKFDPKRMKEFAKFKSNEDLLNLIDSLDEDDQSSAKLASALKKIGYGDYLAERGSPGLSVSGDMSKVGLKSVRRDPLTGDPVKDMFGNTLFDYDEPRDDRGDPSILFPQGIMAQAPSDMDQEPEIEEDEGLRLAFRANGGRIGFFKGAQADTAKGKAMSPGTTASGGFRGGGDDKPTKKPTGSKEPDTFPKKNIFTSGSLQFLNPIKKFIDHDKFTDQMKMTNTPNYHQMGGLDFMARFPNINPDTAKKLASAYQNVFEVGRAIADGPGGKTIDDALDTAKAEAALNAIGIDAFSDPTSEIYKQYTKPSSLLPAVPMAEGGIMNPDIIGGEMDLESARQMYGLGKLVKKVTRTVKKIAKSPIGKAALLYVGGAGLGALGTGTGFAGFKAGLMSPSLMFKNLATSGKGFLTGISGGAIQFPGAAVASNAPGAFKLGEFLTTGKGITTAIAGASALAGLLTPAQEEEAQELARGEGIDIETARNAILAARQDDFRARRFKAEGGFMKEPVAKKTMPLLDLEGQEMDLRAEGGFVPIGRMEKADDVPARLSKNEFVFTADAVRNAGDGDVDKGAEVMYNMMKNLEAGGDVSEESQGLEGARKMFQTSQRLEEVL